MCDIHVHVIKRLHCMEYVYTISSIQKKNVLISCGMLEYI